MLQKLWDELSKFSRENWWLYILLCITLVVVWITGKGNIPELLLLFLANFVANLFIMAAMNSYSNKENSLWVSYHVMATTIFMLLGVYGMVYFGQYQYILWQFSYGIAAIKAFTYYKYNKNISVFNEYTMIVFNIVLLSVFLTQFDFQLTGLLQALWFSCVTIGLVSLNDKIRFWMSYIGMFWIVGGSAYGTYLSYMASNVDGIALGYLLLWLTTFVYFNKLLRKYIPS